MTKHLILIAAWILYCSLHSILANEKIKYRITRSSKISDNNYRLLYNVFALVSLVVILIYQFYLNSRLLFEVTLISKVIAYFLTLSGLAIMIVCIRKYFLQLSGLNTKVTVTRPVLETGGIHRFVRHPLYSGTFIFLAGLFLLIPLLSNFIAVIIIIIYTIIGVRFEEQKLVSLFGSEYKEYQRKVPMLIPFLK
ncbi:MAG: isoprenylcysteine carboxylmethyltransferase family protein [Ferruginibacter sp.]